MIIIKNKVKLSELRLKKLLKKVPTDKGWGDLNLPAPEKKALRQVVEQTQSRKGGLVVLFAGGDSDGKSMVAEVIAGELKLDLYRIDLAAVVGKYIGETEKNLAQIFDAAEASHAVLLFDEADALFGKRTEVKDSHGRCANIEVGYLLQRMEACSGPIILSTNAESKWDPEFRRRIRFKVRFR